MRVEPALGFEASATRYFRTRISGKKLLKLKNKGSKLCLFTFLSLANKLRFYLVIFDKQARKNNAEALFLSASVRSSSCIAKTISCSLKIIH